jgi:hypothetical protein
MRIDRGTCAAGEIGQTLSFAARRQIERVDLRHVVVVTLRAEGDALAVRAPRHAVFRPARRGQPTARMARGSVDEPQVAELRIVVVGGFDHRRHEPAAIGADLRRAHAFHEPDVFVRRAALGRREGDQRDYQAGKQPRDGLFHGRQGIANRGAILHHLPRICLDARLRAVKNLWKPLKWAGALVVMAVGVAGIAVLRVGGAFRSIEPAFAGNCRPIALGGSSEDIVVDRQRGIAYLSLLDRDGARRGEQILGTVMLLDMNRAEPAPRAAMAYDPEAFSPHGLSLLATGSQPARLFVVSHRRDGSHTVEIAEEGTAGGFFPKETIRNAAFVHPNAIAATGARQFYLTNDNLDEGQWALAKQALLRSGVSTLIYFDGDKARVEAADLNVPSGLGLSPDGSWLYVAELWHFSFASTGAMP